MTAEALLLVRGGPDDGSRIALSEGMTKIGLTSANDIVLDEELVSRRHARIRGDSSGFWLSDRGSRNGTFVNGEKLGSEPRLLRNLDRVELGGNTQRVHWVFIESQATIDMPSPSAK